MNNSFRKAADCLLRPLQGGGSFFIFTFGLLLIVLLPVWFLTPTGAKVNLWTFAEAFADSYLLAWALSYLPRMGRHLFQGLIIVVLLSLSVVDFFVKVHFQTFINSAMLRLVLETRGNEVYNFFTSYVLQPSTVLILAPFVLWALAWWYYVSNFDRLRPFLRRVSKKWIILVLVALLFVGEILMIPVKVRTIDVCSAPTVSDMEVKYGDAPVLSLYSPVHRLAFALRSVLLVRQQVIDVRQVHEKMTVTRSDEATPKVVVVIGESFNRAHSQLYGYNLPTTPFQKAREERGELYRFNDVVSCWNLTSYVFQNLMSLHSVDSKDSWGNYPLFPAVYKKAGYRVSFLSNQFSLSVAGSISSFSGSFFMNDPVLGKQMFDYHSPTIVTPVDDANLLTEYDSLHLSAPWELTIFSLVGMHFNYDVRIPSDEWKYFSESLYHAKHLEKEDRQIIADYDNAVRYNDAIIEQILQRFEKENAIVIYCPDHGEELFDGTGVWGRTYPEVLSDAEMHNQFEIPFWVWCSDRFRHAYPEKISRLLRALPLPFMSDDLPHLLLQLTGISCDALDLSRSPLSDTYNTHRRRILRGWQEYHP